MTEKTKIRNSKNESKISFLYNLFILILAAVLVTVIVPHEAKVGIRNTAVLNIMSAVITIIFMTQLEKYSIVISGLYERNLITVLSLLFTFVIMSLINLVFFMSKERLFADLVFSALTLLITVLADCIFEIKLSRQNKPKLLIIDSDDKNFFRMKRIKYGVLKNYESWYESIEGITPEEMEEFVANKFKDFDAICILNGLSEYEYSTAVNAAMEMNKELFIVPKMIDVGKTNAKIVRFDDVLSLYMPKNYITSVEFFVKRVMDIIISLAGLIVAAIPMVLIALAIKLSSPGPIFYKQERMTINKRHFWIYKFRTMVPDAEKLTGPKFAEKDDPRITKIGKILRSCRLDELPQIVNILKGDMSIVGPRPERPVFVQDFEKEIENYNYRFAVKAGLTSLSHVYGRYSTYIHDRTYYDLFYITNYSFWLDLKIILLTAKTMFMKSSAEGEDDFKNKTISNKDTEEALK